MMRRVREYGSWLIVGVFLASMSGYLTSVVVGKLLARPPVKFKLVSVVTPVVRSGTDAQFKMELDRNKTCPSEISGFWVSDYAIYRLPILRGGASRPGKQTILYNIQTAGKDSDGDPFKLTAGRWEYFAVARHYCGSDIYQTESPRVPIQVVE